MKNIAVIIMSVWIMSLFIIFCYGDTESNTNTIISTNDLFTNDTHITKSDDQRITLIYEVEMNQKQIYDKLIEWIAVNYINSKSVIQNKDPDNGQIIGKGVIYYKYDFIFGIQYPSEYTMIIDIKDNKYRIQYNNYTFLSRNSNYRRPFYIPQERNLIYEIDKDLIKQSRKMYNSIISNTNNKDF